ncbi:hypothetical protein OROHE_003775 [Orobanche hederae]
MLKIVAFKLELPLTVLFINDGKVMQCKETNGKPVLEECIPLQKSCYQVEIDKESEDKKDWMSSVQLWNHPETQNLEFSPKENKLVEINKVATPKQIKELTQVDGLTNDEVKSHLQKYRLHTRKVPAGTTPANRPALTLGGPWTCQDQYSELAKQSQSQSGFPQEELRLQEPIALMMMINLRAIAAKHGFTLPSKLMYKYIHQNFCR